MPGGYLQSATSTNLVFTNGVAGDAVLRAVDSTSRLHLGVGSNVSSAISIASTGITMIGNVSATIDKTGTLDIGTSLASTLNLGTASGTQTINLGTGSGVTTINIGGAGDTVNVAGTLTYINTTNTTVTDQNIILNKGGAASSGLGAGLSVEEAGEVAGYIQTDSSTGAAWQIKAPRAAGVVSIGSATAGGAQIDVVGGGIRVDGSILPASNVTYDLGSSNQRFRDLYLSGQTIFMGGTQITTDNTSSSNIKLIDTATGTLKRLVVDELQIGEGNDVVRVAKNNGKVTFSTVTNNITTEVSGLSNVYPVNGRIGIGMSNPASLLDVAGDINFTGSLLQNGAAYVGSQWTTGSNSVITYNAGSVGIGKTPDASYALDVAGTINATNILINGQAISAGSNNGGSGSGGNTYTTVSNNYTISGGTGTGSILTVDPSAIVAMNQMYKVMPAMGDAAAADYFSYSAVSVSSDASLMAVGASQKGSGAGKLYLYTRATNAGSSAAWTVAASGDYAVAGVNVGAASEGLGSGVAAATDGAGNRVVLVGASGATKAYIYVFNTSAVSGLTTNKWNRVALATNAGGAFGGAVALTYVAAESGYVAVVGDASAAKTYAYFIPVSTYAPVLLGSAYSGAGGLGSSVAISSDSKYIIAGAPSAVNGSSVATGSAVVLLKTGTGSGATFALSTTIYPSDGAAAGMLFGSSVATASTGAFFAVGAPAANTAAGIGAGALYVYNRASSYAEVKLSAADTVSGDALGSSVAMDATGAYIVVGAAPEANGGLAGAGAAYIFQYASSMWTYSSKLKPLDSAMNAGFGQAVALSSGASYVAVGSYNNTHAAASAGAVYWFVSQTNAFQANSLTATATVGGAGVSNVNMTTSGVARLSIVGSNVGIRNPSPMFALDINGDLNFTGSLRSNGVAYVGSQWSTSNAGLLVYGSNVQVGGTVSASNFVGSISWSNIVDAPVGITNSTTLAVSVEPDYYELMQGASDLSFSGGYTYTSSPFTISTMGGVSAFVAYAGTAFIASGTGKISATVSLMSSGVAVADSTKVTSAFSAGGQVAFPALEYKVANVAAGTYTVRVVFSANSSCDSNSVHNLAVKILKNTGTSAISAMAMLGGMVPSVTLTYSSMAPECNELLQNSSAIVFSGGYTYNSSSFTTTSGGSALVNYSGTGFSTSASAKISATVSLISGGSTVANSTKTVSAFNFGSHAALPTLSYKVPVVAGSTYTVRIVFSSNMSSDANDSHSLSVNVLRDSIATSVPAFVQSMSNISFSNSATSTMGALTVGGDLTVDNVDAKASTILNIGANAATTTLNLGTNGSTQAINMGTGSGIKTITIGGGTDDTIAINGNLTVAGTTVTVNSSNATILDKVITLNKGGAAASGGLVGLEIEEAGSAAGAYLRTNATRDAWVAKAPNGSEVTIGGAYTTNAPLSISGTTLSIANATTSAPGVVQVGSGLSVSSGIVSVGTKSTLTISSATQMTSGISGWAYGYPSNSFTVTPGKLERIHFNLSALTSQGGLLLDFYDSTSAKWVSDSGTTLYTSLMAVQNFNGTFSFPKWYNFTRYPHQMVSLNISATGTAQQQISGVIEGFNQVSTHVLFNFQGASWGQFVTNTPGYPNPNSAAMSIYNSADMSITAMRFIIAGNVAMSGTASGSVIVEEF